MAKGKEKAEPYGQDSDNVDELDDDVDGDNASYEEDESDDSSSNDDVSSGEVRDSDESSQDNASESDMVEDKDEESWLERGSHPLGVQPTGNMWLREDLQDCENCRKLGLGCLAALKDELLITLLGHVGAHELAALACTSKVLYAFCYHEELWRELVIDDFGADGFMFRSTWRETYVSEAARRGNTSGGCEAGPAPCTLRGAPGSAPLMPPTITVPHLFSDVLFQPWRCASAMFRPEWLAIVKVDVHAAAALPVAQFVEQYERRNKPVLIQGGAAWGPASLGGWSRDELARACGGARFACGPVELTLQQYLSYADSVREEQPVYLFDSAFAAKAPLLATAYTVPPYFVDDLFAVMGEGDRPDYRWLIVGPRRSGSRFHVDPNGTSAWNLVLRGRKKWVMYPPRAPPPGVFPSPDGAEVASPVSVFEWFLNFYKPGEAPVEFVQEVGDVVFVPSGWWHCVYNLGEGDNIAVTQNLCSPASLHRVLRFLRERPEQISGLKRGTDRDAFVRAFLARLADERPGLSDVATKGGGSGGVGKLSVWSAPDIKQEFKFGFGAG